MNHIQRWCEAYYRDTLTVPSPFPACFWREVQGYLEELFELYAVRDLERTAYGVKATIANGRIGQEKTAEAFWIYVAPEEGIEEGVAFQVKAGWYTFCPPHFLGMKTLIQQELGFPEGTWKFQKR